VARRERLFVIRLQAVRPGVLRVKRTMRLENEVDLPCNPELLADLVLRHALVLAVGRPRLLLTVVAEQVGQVEHVELGS